MSVVSEAATLSRDDIEAKFKEINREVQSGARAAAPVGVAIGAAVVFGVIGLAYVLGRRRGRKRSTVVEIRRI